MNTTHAPKIVSGLCEIELVTYVHKNNWYNWIEHETNTITNENLCSRVSVSQSTGQTNDTDFDS